MTRLRALFAAVLVTGLASVPATAQEFGGTVLLSDGQLLISESFDPAGPGPDGTPRTLYIYSRVGSGWEQTGSLQAPDHEGSDFFGRFVEADCRGSRLSLLDGFQYGVKVQLGVTRCCQTADDTCQ